MSITFTCRCGKPVTVPDEFAGRSGTCKGCGAKLLVPFLSTGGGVSAVGGAVSPLSEPSWSSTEVCQVAVVPAPQPIPQQHRQSSLADVRVDPSLLPATHRPVKKPRAFWKDPYILSGVGIPAIILGVFAFYLHSESKRQGIEGEIKTLAREGKQFVDRGSPVDASGKYSQAIDLAKSIDVKDDDAKKATTDAIAAQERLGPIIAKLKAREEADKIAKQKAIDEEIAAKEAQEQWTRKTFAPLEREAKLYREHQEKYAHISATLPGGAFLNLVGNRSELLRGLVIFRLPRMVPLSALDDFLARLQAKTESNGDRTAINVLRMAPKDTLVDLGIIYALCRDHIGRKSKLSEPERYTIAMSDTSWVKLVISLAIDSVKTNIEGKYKFENVKGGSYYLYSLYDTPITFAEWFIRVSVEKTSATEFDFENGAAALLLNSSGTP